VRLTCGKQSYVYSEYALWLGIGCTDVPRTREEAFGLSSSLERYGKVFGTLEEAASFAHVLVTFG